MKRLTITAAALALAAVLATGPALGRGPWAANRGNTVGWQLMTPAERIEHQDKMRSFKTYDECKVYQEQHHQQIEARAKDKGLTLPAMRPGAYACDNMKARGFLK